MGKRLKLLKRQQWLIVGVALALAGYLLWIYGPWAQASPDLLTGNGTVEATEVDVGSQRSARLLKFAVDEGQAVHQGQLLAVLDTSELDAQVRQAADAAQAAESRLQQSLVGTRPEQIASAQGALQQAQANAAGAARTLGNAQTGYEHRTSLKQAVDAAATQLRTANDAVTQAQAALAGAQKLLATSDASFRSSLELQTQRDTAHQQYQAALAQADAAQAALAQAQSDETAAVSTDRTNRADYERAASLFHDGAISAQALDQARWKTETSQAQLNAARQAVSRAEATLAQAQANVKGSRQVAADTQQLLNDRLSPRAQLESAQTQVSTLTAQLFSARAAREGARAALQHARQTYADSLTERQSLDTARQQHQAARAQVDIAQAQLEQLRNGDTLQVRDQLKAQAAQARAALKLAKVQRSQADIYAPRDGVVTDLVSQPGEVMTPGSTLLKLVDLRHAYVWIYLPLDRLGRVRLGQSVEIRADTFPNKVYRGSVEQVSDTPEFTPKNVQTKDERVKLVFGVKVALQNNTGDLKPGMPVDATLR